jgi:hypothetical protein
MADGKSHSALNIDAHRRTTLGGLLDGVAQVLTGVLVQDHGDSF